MNQMQQLFAPVRHGLMLSILALILGIGWAGYLALNHERLHGGFEAQEKTIHREARTSHALSVTPLLDAILPLAMAHGDAQHVPQTTPTPGEDARPAHQHSHSGSLANDAMERLLRGHIHWMGLGILSAALLLIVAFTSLRPAWKSLLGWTFGLGALAYPPAWILMGFRTVRLGPEVAEQSVMWLFAPTAGMVLLSLVVALGIIAIEAYNLHQRIPLCTRLFTSAKS